jgi:hypothetical protein
MTDRQVHPGDLVAIPAGVNREIVGHVLFCSAYFRNVVLLALYPVDASRMPAEIPEPQRQRRLLFTGNQAIVTGRWRKLGSLEPSNEPSIIRFISGGDVWENDNPLRAATGTDYVSLPKMLVKGVGLVEKTAQSLVELSSEE